MKKIVIIAGITASGKTKLGIQLAKHFNACIINGDSVSIYKELNIGAAKPSLDEQNLIKHHLLNIRSIFDETKYSIFDFQRDARDIIEKNDFSIIVGGSALYVRSVIYDYQLSKEKIKVYKDSYVNKDELIEHIVKLDPNYKHNQSTSLRRLQRYYEILLNNHSLGDAQSLNICKNYNPLVIFLNIARDKQKDVFLDRLNKQISQGFINEVKSINKHLNIIGYDEIFQYTQNLSTLEEAKEKILYRSLRFAKKQKTFFLNQFNAHVFEYDDPNLLGKVIELIKTFYK